MPQTGGLQTAEAYCRMGGMIQVVEHLPGKHEALSSIPIPSTTKKQTKRNFIAHGSER
jgi:hypothetical protein